MVKTVGKNKSGLLELKNNLTAILDTLQKETGEDWKELIYRVARCDGQRIYQKAISNSDITPDGLGFQKCLEIYKRTGLGNLKVKQMAWDKGWAVIECPDCFEAVTISKRKGVSSEPVCNYTRGILTGFMEETHIKAGQPVNELICIEDVCLGSGEELCRFLVGSRDDILLRGFKSLPLAVSPHSETHLQINEKAESRIVIVDSLIEHIPHNLRIKDLMRNIKKLRQAHAKQKELSRMKSHFVSVVSHELRTPISVIKGYLELLGDEVVGELAPKQKGILTSTLRHIHHLNQLVNGILDIQRIEEGKLKLNLENLRLKDLVEKSMENLKPLAEKRGHELVCLLPTDIPAIHGDRTRMALVFDNLLDNAIKFMTNAGQVRVTAQKEGGNIHVQVSDTGMGIPEKERHKIFKRFQFVENHAKASYTGVGLGLSIVKGIIDEHHGKIWVDSEEGKGSTFHLLLPAAKGNRSDAKS